MFGKGGGGKKESKPDYSKVSLDDFSDDDSSGHAMDDDDAEYGIRTNQMLMKEQDQGLDMLSSAVTRLGELSMGIHDELGQQNQMLESMETDLDTAGEELDIVTQKTKQFIDQVGGKSNCVLILSLAGIALVLFFLLLYT